MYLFNIISNVLTVACLFSQLSILHAQQSPTTIVSRWIDPSGSPRPRHTAPNNFRSFKIKVHHSATAKVAGTNSVNQGRICLLVHSAIIDSIADALDQYQIELTSQGFTVLLSEFISGNAESVRQYFKDIYAEPQSLKGAVCIGDIPFIIYEMMQTWGNDDPEYEDFPCDLFFMDLDGTWKDQLNYLDVQAGNNKYDTWTGNRDLEIWTCRWKTGRLPSIGSETNLINQYIKKNIGFRQGLLHPARRSIVYVDDDWAYDAEADSINLDGLYPGASVSAIYKNDKTNAWDYRTNQMTADAEFMFMRSHGYPRGHGFTDGSENFETIRSYEYASKDPAALFYSFFVCSGADYTWSDCLASLTAFNPDNSGLLSWGSTKTGGMLHDKFFYNSLKLGNTFGEAFRNWFNSVNNYGSWTGPWFYGMTLIGDATLTIFTPPPEPPQNLASKNNGETIKLFWSKNLEIDLAGYKIYRESSTSVWSEIGSTGVIQHQYSDDDVLQGTTYHYKIAAIDSDGKMSLFSNTIEIIADSANTPPLFTVIKEAHFLEDTGIVVAFQQFYPFVEDANCTDEDLKWSIAGGQFLTCLQRTNDFSIHAPLHWFGTDTLKISASDGIMHATTQWIIHIDPVNDAPRFTSNMPDTIQFSAAEQYCLQLNQLIEDVDTDSENISWEWQWASPQSKTGIIVDKNHGNELTLQTVYNISTCRRISFKISDGELHAEYSTWIMTEKSTTPYAVAGTYPDKFELKQNYPNPFNAGTNIFYSLPEECDVTLSVYNSLGQLYCTLLDKHQAQGSYNIPWQAQHAASGTYIITLKAEGTKHYSASKKIIVTK